MIDNLMTFINFRIPYVFHKSNIFPFHKETFFILYLTKVVVRIQFSQLT